VKLVGGRLTTKVPKIYALNTRSLITFKQLRMLVIVLILNVPALGLWITTVAMAFFACSPQITAFARGRNHGLVTARESSYPWKYGKLGYGGCGLWCLLKILTFVRYYLLPDVCFLLHFVYFHPSRVKVRVNLYQVFQACIVHEHVQIQLLCNWVWRKKFVPKRRCQPTNLKGVKAQWFGCVCSEYYGIAKFLCSCIILWKQYRDCHAKVHCLILL